MKKNAKTLRRGDAGALNRRLQQREAKQLSRPIGPQQIALLAGRKNYMADFQPGCVIRHRSGGDGYIVHANYGKYAVALRGFHITNPDEWLILQKP